MRTGRRVLLAGVCLAVAVAVAVALTPLIRRAAHPAGQPGRGQPAAEAAGPAPFRPAFPDAGLVTNEHAFRHPDQPASRQSPDWVVTSGSLFGRAGAGWTGPVDHLSPGADSVAGTNSGTFRLVSRRRDFTDVQLTCRVRLIGLTAGGEGAHAYDGVHLWLRYASPDQLYAVTLARRDGRVVIKRKAAVDGRPGTYVDLAARRWPLRTGQWLTVRTRITNTPDGPRIVLAIDGRRLLDTVDTAPDAIRGTGGVGFRGDNAEFEFRDVTATGVQPLVGVAALS